MANNAHYATAYTGGGNALDGIATPTDGDLAFVTVDGYSGSMHRFNSGNTGSENSPWIILPDDSTTGAWEMVAKSGDHVQTMSTIITAESTYSNPSVWTDVTDFDISITPNLAGSIIRLTFDIHGMNGGYSGGVSTPSYYKIVYNVGGGSYVDSPLLGDNATRCAVYIGSSYPMIGIMFEHSPVYAVGQTLNYKLQVGSGSGGTASLTFNNGNSASMIMAEEFAVVS